jgi:hypothetical protein
LKQFGPRKVEANALVVRPQAGRDLCRRAILQYVDDYAVAEYDHLIDIEQEKVKHLVTEMLKGGAV